MIDQIILLENKVPKCLVGLDPSLRVGTNFNAQLGTADTWVNVKWFGAKGNGVDNDAPAIRDAVSYALNNRRTLWFPSGDYGVAGPDPGEPNSCIYIPANKDVSVQMDQMATIKALPNFGLPTVNASTRLVRIDSGDGSGRLSWYGGKLDLSALPGSTTGVGGLVISHKYRTVSVRDVTFDHGVKFASGNNFGAGGGDTSLFIKEAEHVEITGCDFMGAPDLGIYLT